MQVADTGIQFLLPGVKLSFLDPSSQGTTFVFEAKPAITLNILTL